jgi:hypothetical protein
MAGCGSLVYPHAVEQVGNLQHVLGAGAKQLGVEKCCNDVLQSQMPADIQCH